MASPAVVFRCLPMCPVCGDAPAVTLAERRHFPMFVNMVRSTKEEARAVECGDVTFVGCATCGHVWNRTFEPERLVFDPSYNPDQVGSPAFDRHIAEVADRIAKACASFERIDLLEIGCGQGDFLQQMVDRFGDRVGTARGFDPAFWDGKPRFRDARIRVERRYFDDSALASFDSASPGGRPNVVISRHAVQHVPEPRGFYKNVRSVMSPNNGRFFIEAPDVSFIFANATTYDLFYEHCCLYAPSSMARALRDAGFAVSAIQPAFNSQYLLAEASLDPAADTFLAPRVSPPESLVDADKKFVAGWRTRIAGAADRGPVLLWGAGAKGASFCLLVDPDVELLGGVVDINATKQGRFVPGTGHQILAPDHAGVLSAGTVIVSNANYKDEIASALKARGSNADVWTLDDATA